MDRRRFLSVLLGAAPAGAAFGAGAPPAPWRAGAIRYLVGRQSGDGAWRSGVYGAFKDGSGLTPLVMRALAPWRPAVVDVAARWIVANTGRDRSIFPVHNATWLLECAARCRAVAPLRASLAEHLRNLQLGSGRGWRETDPAFGGWSYAGEAPSWRSGAPLAPMQEPNLSATVLAVAGLRAAGVSPDDRALREAAVFIRRCQNLPAEGRRGKFDDGGFFQMASDASRNKAGRTGVDATGRPRFRSYGSATADGLRGLLLTGSARSDRGVAAAAAWLDAHPALDDVPDLAFYSGYARREAGRLLGREPAPKLPGRPATDGSFVNPAGEMREDDPLVATSLALMA